MAGIIDFSQIFSDGDQQSTNTSVVKAQRQYFEVPEAPVCTDIPDLDMLLSGDGKNSLLDLQPSQWMPSSQTSHWLTSAQTYKTGFNKSQISHKQVYSDTVSERGDCDDIYLGSQYPLVHKIGPSQVPVSSQRQVMNIQSQIPPSQRAKKVKIIPKLDKQPNKNSAYVFPRKTEPSSTVLKTVNSRGNSYATSANRIQPLPIDRRRTYTVNRMNSHLGDNAQPGNRISSPPREDENASQEDLFEDSTSHSPAAGHQTTGRSRMDQFTTAGRTPRDQLYSPALVAVPLEQYRMGVKLRPVTEIQNFRRIFNFPHFNIVQSKVFDDVMYTDKCLVLCSPTGSGKTAVFEMAIVRLMTRPDTNFTRNFKIVYMAPIKALCSERFSDWKMKFELYGLKIMELTGDTDNDEFYELQQVNIILTTPEKWDSMTRKWRDNKAVMHAIGLFLIDEIHILNDPSRGSVVEAVVSRMKTIQAARHRSSAMDNLPTLRFIAISATITNIEDLAEWLGHGKIPAVHYKLDESVRPVRLRKVVLGYHFVENKQSEFQFDISLSYKLAGVINTYSDNKPVLVFCATRKSSMQGAEILSKDVKSLYIRSAEHRLTLQNLSFHIKDTKLRDLVVKGIGYHHAGMDVQDRKLIEEIFANGELPVLVATSTLAMGVNLPAHLVIVKSTMFYNMGSHQEYPDTQVLQMIGRAGRPQFDTSATAVIMTKNSTKMKYENLLNGTQLIESSLHKNLVEHLNAEIVLNTITDISVAVEWLKYTFLYIRVMKNPRHYGMPSGLTRQSIENRLQDLCMKSLNQLHRLSLIQMNEENMDVRPTESGRLMARYCISCKTAELFLAFKGDESVSDMLNIISKCEEFEDIKLRNNEKKTLNTLNKDKNRITVRYPMSGKIKTTDMKVNCLIQATLSSLLIQDFALQQDTARIFRAGIRVTRCLVELLSQKNNYRCMLSALLLCKSFKARLWEDSKYVSKQLDGIGPTLSTALVNAGLTSFEKIEETNPREIELIVNRHPPFGNQVKDNISKLPKYELVIEQVMRYSVSTAEIVITLQITNRDTLKESTGHTCTLLVGDEDNKVLYKQRIMDALLLKEKSWSKKLEVRKAGKGPELSVHYISQDWVGLDVECTYTPNYLGGKRITSSSVGNNQAKPAVTPGNCATLNLPCLHTCHNKMTCAHECCKHGVSSKRRNTSNQQTPRQVSTKRVASHLQELKNRAASLPPTPSVSKRLKLQDNSNTDRIDLRQFTYTPNRSNQDFVNQAVAMSDDEFGKYGGPANDLSNHYGQERQSFQPRQQTFQLEGRPRNDWEELDMYAKHRQTCNPDDNILDDQESLPDLEATREELAVSRPNWATVQNGNMLDSFEDDIAHETEYGYAYVTGEDRPELPLEWDDRVNEQWQKGSRNQWNDAVYHDGRQINNSSVQRLIQGRDDRLGGNHSWSRSPFRKHLVDGTTPRSTALCDLNQSDNDTESAVGRVSVNKKCRPDSFHNGWTRKTQETPNNKLGQVYFGKMQRNIEKDAVGNKDRFSQYASTNGRDDRVNTNLRHVTNETNSLTGILKNKNESVMVGTATDTECFESANETGDVENIDPDLYVDLYNEEFERNPSKWTSYFSSQSSSASDNLNWKYPARNDGNQVVMEKCDFLNTQNTDQEAARKKCITSVNRNKLKNYGNVTSRNLDEGQAHKYGQVLAWVSSSENHQQDETDEKQYENSRSDQPGSLPDKMDSFASIFDGIL